MKKYFINHYLFMLLTLLAFTLQGCGFHLRSNTFSSHSLTDLKVVGKDQVMSAEMKKALTASGASISSGARYQVHILDFETSETGHAFATAAISAVTLKAKVKWVLETASGQALFVPRTVSSSVASQSANGYFNVDEMSTLNSRSIVANQVAMAIVRQISAISEGQLLEMKRHIEKQKLQEKTANLRSLAPDHHSSNTR